MSSHAGASLTPTTAEECESGRGWRARCSGLLGTLGTYMSCWFRSAYACFNYACSSIADIP